MNSNSIFVTISIVVLLIVAIFVFFVNKNRKETKLTLLAGLALIFILAGLFFGSNRVTGYGLLGLGVILAVIDIFRKSKGK